MDPREARRQLKCCRLRHNFATVNADRSRGVGSSLKLGEQPLTLFRRLSTHHASLSPSCAVLCYDRRTCSKQYARQVTAEPGASTVASVINIARPSMSFSVNRLRWSTCRREIRWVESLGQNQIDIYIEYYYRILLSDKNLLNLIAINFSNNLSNTLKREMGL